MAASPAQWSGGSDVPGADAAYHAVLRAPDDDAPRLAYADLVEPRDDRHARFIRAQIQLVEARKRRSPASVRLRGLVQSLRNDRAWSGPAPQWVDSFQLRRGFIDDVTLRCSDYLTRAADLPRLFPVRHLTVTSADAAGIASLCRDSHLSRLRSLAVRGAIGDDGARALAGCRALAGVRWLDLSRCDIGPAGLEAVAGSSFLRPRYLGFGGNRAPDPRPALDYDGSTGQALGHIFSSATYELRNRFPGLPWLEPLDVPDNSYEPPDRDDV